MTQPPRERHPALADFLVGRGEPPSAEILRAHRLAAFAYTTLPPDHPLRPELRQCVALDPMPPEALPPVSEDPAVRSTQLEERAAWMMRDIHQADIAREMCNRQGELIGLIDANNAGPEN